MKKLLFALLVLMMTSAQGQFMVPNFYVHNTSFLGGNTLPGLVFVTDFGLDTLEFELCAGISDDSLTEDSHTVESRIMVLAQAMKEAKKCIKSKYAVVTDTSFCTLYFSVHMPMKAERVLGNIPFYYSQEEYASQIKRWTQTSKRLNDLVPALLAREMHLEDQLSPATPIQLETLIKDGYPAALVKALGADIRSDLDLCRALNRRFERLSK